MRYSDRPSVEVEVYVDAPPSRVWELVCDVDLPARFSSEFKGAAWLDGRDRPDLGAKFRGRNEHPAAGEWATTSTVIAYEPQRCLAWAVQDPTNPSATWRFDLEPEGDGTRLRQSARFGPGPSGLSAVIESMPDKEERIIARRLTEHRENMTRTVEGIKGLAETN